MTSTTPTPAATATAKAMPAFRYSIAGLCAAEAALGARLGAILAEAASTEGLSVRTLRALVAAGLEPKTSVPTPAPLWFDEGRAEKIIAAHGIQACVTAIAVPLAQFLVEVR